MSFLEVAEKAALEGARRALSLQGDLQVSYKEDGSLITNADKEAEKAIIGAIRARCPSHRIISEEGGGVDNASDYVWAIDPIDGTSAYINHESTWCINIALLKNNKPFLGVLYNPVTRDLFTSEGKQSKCNRVSLPHIKLPLEEGTVNYKYSKKIKKDNDIISGIWEGNFKKLLDTGGSPAFSLALVAKGSHSCFIMNVTRKTRPEDLSSGYLLVKNAGGRITDLKGEEIDPLNHSGYMIASANRHVHKKMLDLLRKHNFGGGLRSMILIGGLYGTGKTTIGMKLEKALGYSRYNSDLVRRKFRLTEYDEDDSGLIWATIHRNAEQDLSSGRGVIIESTFLNGEQRRPELDIANRHDADVMFIEVVCPEDVAKARMLERKTSPDGLHVPTNRSEVYDRIKGKWEAITSDRIRELGISYIEFDSSKEKVNLYAINDRHTFWAKEIIRIVES
jgi:fructose-1,6-bisphosphatase/inositol monophosphatase family enzyme/predicted kinase